VTDGWPRFFLFGTRPVKAVQTSDGGLDVQAYQWETGDFERDMLLGTEVIMGGPDVERVSQEQFESAVEHLRQKLRSKR